MGKVARRRLPILIRQEEGGQRKEGRREKKSDC